TEARGTVGARLGIRLAALRAHGRPCGHHRPRSDRLTKTDVLIIGAGAAGMNAALAAASASARVLLVDRSLIGRGGATVMAQMTVAAAIGEEEPDHWEHHLVDTLKAGRGLCDESLSRLLCEEGPE